MSDRKHSAKCKQERLEQTIIISQSEEEGDRKKCIHTEHKGKVKKEKNNSCNGYLSTASGNAQERKELPKLFSFSLSLPQEWETLIDDFHHGGARRNQWTSSDYAGLSLLSLSLSTLRKDVPLNPKLHSDYAILDSDFATAEHLLTRLVNTL